MDYKEFIESKKKVIQDNGFEVKELNPKLKDFQKHIVKLALKRGRYAIFADTGMGKTIMQLEWASQVVEHTNKPVLLLTPIAVSGQTILEHEKFKIKTPIKKYDGKLDCSIQITNYEQLENIDISIFSGVVLDESSILKNFNGKTKELIIDLFNNYQYKLACTASPSPNDEMEMGNHSEFLNVMSRNEMLAMYFVHDGGETAKWRLKGHAENQFYSWISEWATMIRNPSDLGFNGSEYILPKLSYFEHEIQTEKKDNGSFFNDGHVSAITYNQELRNTSKDRLDKVIEIVNSYQGQMIIWIKHNDEGIYLEKQIYSSVNVHGSMSTDQKEFYLIGFAKNDFRVLITKSKIAQFGLNYQNCSMQIFASLDFSFESLYQSIRRSYRFGQKNEVNIHLITTDTMGNVIQSIKEKSDKFENTYKKMTEKINHKKKEKLKMNVKDYIEDDYKLLYGDCVERIKEIEDESLGFSIFSPPFAELYTYSDEVADMGNSKDYNEFFTAFNFMINELFKKIKTGRNVAIHCMDLPIQKGKEGYIGLRDFSGMIINSFQSAGFVYHSRVTIWKDPVIEMQRTKALGLLHKQVKKNSAMSRVGIPDYLLVFRKDGEPLDPVRCDIDVDTWQKYASPIWYDIKYGNTLNKNGARDDKDEKHICPLQLDTIERSISLWTNKGDIVFTPFMGIGSEVYQALSMGRKAIGIELKMSYFDMACKNVDKFKKESKQLTMEDFLK